MSILRSHIATVTASRANNVSFTDRSQNSGVDIPAVRDSTVFSMRLKDSKAADALVNCGAALAAGKASLYWVEDRKELPWFLREADKSYPSQVTIIEGSAQPPAALTRPYDVQTPLHNDTFIGCLMSGLSKEQYAEGHAHLKQIDASLKGLGSANNYCEGISVKTNEFDDSPQHALTLDLNAVRGARSCVFYAYDGQSRPSGMWVEAGYAIEAGKPCTFLVPSKDCMPEGLRQDFANVKVIEYGDHANFLGTLHSAPQEWLTSP